MKNIIEYHHILAIVYICLNAIAIVPNASSQGLCYTFNTQSMQNKRVMGGLPTNPHAYPWVVLIRRDGQPHCTGSLIRNNWVATSSHCLQSDGIHEVNAGVHNFSDTNNLCEQTRQVTQDNFFRHEGYQSIIPGKFINDIALIQIYPPFDIDDPLECVRPIEIYENLNDTDNYEDFIIAGWGSDALNTGPLEILHEVTIPFVSDSRCQDAYEGISDYEDILLCAGVTGSGACLGDDGSPLFREEDDKYLLYGVMSWSEGCGRTGCPDVFTEITSFIEWINTTIEKAPIIVSTTTTEISTTSPVTITSTSSSSSTNTVPSSSITTLIPTSTVSTSLAPTTISPTETTTSASPPRISFSFFILHIYVAALLSLL